MEMTILNTAFIIYFIVSGYQWFKYRKIMSEGSLHHFWSHNAIVFLFTISINFWILEGSWVSLVFVIASFTHLLQHVMKENYRLIHDGKWAKDLDKSVEL